MLNRLSKIIKSNDQFTKDEIVDYVFRNIKPHTTKSMINSKNKFNIYNTSDNDEVKENKEEENNDEMEQNENENKNNENINGQNDNKNNNQDEKKKNDDNNINEKDKNKDKKDSE